MLLQTAKIWYNENGTFVEIQDLISLDVIYTKVTSREDADRSGSFTNETIDAIEINFKRGSNTLLDALKPDSEVKLPIKYLNGAISIQGPFVVTSKTTTRQFNGDKNTFMRLKPYEKGEFIIAARGGEGGHVDDVEVNGVSVVHEGVAEIELTPYAKKTEVETELDKKLNKNGDTMTGNLTMAGHIINMVGGRITNVTKGSDDDAVPLKYIKDNFAQGTQVTQIQTDLASEVSRAINAENTLANGLSSEVTNRVNADTALYDAITAEKTRAEGVEDVLESYCDSLDVTKQDILPTAVKGKYLHSNETTGNLEWKEAGGGTYTAGNNIDITDNVISAKDVVTTNTVQTISGNKNFTGNLTQDSNAVLTTSTGYTKSQIEGFLDEKVDKTSIVDSVSSASTTEIAPLKTIKYLNDRINNLSIGGRYLSGWNCSTGLPQTDPSTIPYTYKSGDYYIISAIAAETNYKPSGSEYTGAPSTTVEVGIPELNDYYRYDGSKWSLVKTAAFLAEFATISGDAKDNVSLKGYLDDLQTSITAETTRAIAEEDKKINLLGNEAISGQPYNIPYHIADLRYDATDSKIKANLMTVTIDNNKTLKQFPLEVQIPTGGSYTAGDNIDITDNVIKAKDVVTTNTEQVIDKAKTFNDLPETKQTAKIGANGLELENSYYEDIYNTTYANGTIETEVGDKQYAAFIPLKNGTLLVSSDLEKVVTIDTNQSISGTKTFEISSTSTDSVTVAPEKITATKYFVNEGERLTTLAKADYKSTGITSYIANNTYNLAFPDKSGVIALTSDIPSLTGDFVPRVTTTSPSTELEDKTIMYDGETTASWTRGHIYHSYPVYYWEHNCTDSELGTTFVAYTRQALTSTPAQIYYDVACEMPMLYTATTTTLYSAGTTIAVGGVTSSTRKIDGKKWEDITPTTDLSNYYTKTQTNNLFQTFYNGIYPVGSIYFGFQAPGVPNGVSATWTLQTTYNAKALWVDTTKSVGTSITQALPKPTLTFTGSSATTNSTGAHTHTRGTMEITGSMGSICNQNGTATGCFTYTRDNNAELSGSNQSRGTWTFTASNNWTGATSSNGAHTHTVTAKGSVTCNTSGPYGSGTIVQPPAVAISCWKRTA